MDSEFIKSVELNGDQLRLTADRDQKVVCIENGDNMLHLHNLKQLRTLKSMLYEIIYWWESIEKKENKP
jgi:hypothetical protein